MLEDNRFVICISRKYGSGGHNIGRKLADMLGVKCYDKQLVELAAKKSGLSDAYVRQEDEKVDNNFLNKLAKDTYSYGYAYYAPNEGSINESVFMAEQTVIKELAASESCVIVGRCADYILSEDADMLSVFVNAPLRSRIKTIMKRCSVDEASAEKMIKEVDKKREKYYFEYTDGKWSDIDNYDMTLDASICGEEGAARTIRKLLEEKIRNKG